MISRSWWEL